MRFLHTADLHIGKTVNEFSMQKDQAHVLAQMVQAAKQYGADAFVIAGDVYDRSVPAAEAVELLDAFLSALVRENIPVLMVAGNHDSGKRLAFAREILARNQVHIVGEGADAKSVVIGDTRFVLLPFVRPAEVGAQNSDQALRLQLEQLEPSGAADGPANGAAADPATGTANGPAIGAEAADSATDTATGAEGDDSGAAAGLPADPGIRNSVLVAHCFVTAAGSGPALSDSETMVHVGGIDNVDVSAFEGFSYVALGHIHKPQRIGGQNVWYAGTPLAYSFSEDSGEKGMNLVTLEEDGGVTVERIGLQPLHAMRMVRGSLEELLAEGERLRQEEQAAGPAGAAPRLDYLRAVLTDEDELLNPMDTLRSVYPNVMQIVLAKNERRGEAGEPERFTTGPRPGMEELFASFYELVKGEPMDERRRALVADIARETERTAE